MEMDKVIMDLPVKPENAKKVIDLLYDEPILTRNKMSEITGIKLTTINGIVKALLDKEIIKETTGYSRNQIFAFEKYISDHNYNEIKALVAFSGKVTVDGSEYSEVGINKIAEKD